MLELTWCLPGEVAGHVSLVCSVFVAERAVPLPPESSCVTGRSDCAQPPAPVGPRQRQAPPSTTSLCRCNSCPGESSRPTPHPSTTRPKPVLLKGTQRQARPPQGTEEGICVYQRHTQTAELTSPSAHSLYQGLDSHLLEPLWPLPWVCPLGMPCACHVHTPDPRDG